MADEIFLGQDFDLGFIADEEGRVFAGPYSRVDLQAKLREEVAPRTMDLRMVNGKANLIQSLILRLKTERGELAGLGHPNYGSRHHELIGEPNTEGNRNLIKLYVLECLKQEPRLEAIQRIDVRPSQGRENRDKVDIYITVQMKGFPDPLSLVIPFLFEGPL
ncbi:MAG TPA: GPW/gp25 family protein [Candidatus Limnocylindrales bacterium]|nr:GPW/gp25 family protein [Candidatus Limnocylindrales bacterium]